MRSFLVFLLLTGAHLIWAQVKDIHIKEKLIGIKARIEAKKSKLDTLRSPLDTIKISLKSDTLKQLTSVVDSTKNSIDQMATLDSLRHSNQEKFKYETEELNQLLKAKSDTAADLLNGNRAYFDRVTNKRVTVEGELPIDNLPELKVPEIPAIDSSIPTELGNSMVDLQKQVPTLTSTPISLPAVDGNLPGTIPRVDILTDSVSRAQVADSLKTRAIFEIQKIDTETAGELTDIANKIDPYKKRLDSITWKDVAEIGYTELEAAARSIEDVELMNAELNKLTVLKAQQEALVQRYRDQKLLTEEFKRKSRNVANDQLNKLSPPFKNMQEKICKTKKTYSSVHSLKDLPKRPPNELKGKPFYERVIPGISIQPYISDSYSLEIGPQVGYKFTMRLSGGVGGMYRVSFSRNYTYYAQSEGAYGLRAYADFNVFKSFNLHGEVGSLKLANDVHPLQESALQNVWFGHVGASKQFDISRKLSGELVALYRIEFDRYIPGVNKFSVRMVINYKTKKVRKPTDID